MIMIWDVPFWADGKIKMSALAIFYKNKIRISFRFCDFRSYCVISGFISNPETDLKLLNLTTKLIGHNRNRIDLNKI